MNKYRISETEWRVMQVLWAQSPLYSKDIFAKLGDSGWTFATIKTLINRLVKKNAIGYEKEGKNYKYYPLKNKKDCIQEESRRFIDRIFHGSRKEFITSFVKDTSLTSEEILELRKLLDNKEDR